MDIDIIYIIIFIIILVLSPNFEGKKNIMMHQEAFNGFCSGHNYYVNNNNNNYFDKAIF